MTVALQQNIPQEATPSCFSVLLILRCILETEGLVMIPNENPVCNHLRTDHVLSNFPDWKTVCLLTQWDSGIQRFTKVLEVFDLQFFRIIPCGVAEWLPLVRECYYYIKKSKKSMHVSLMPFSLLRGSEVL